MEDSMLRCHQERAPSKALLLDDPPTSPKSDELEISQPLERDP